MNARQVVQCGAPMAEAAHQHSAAGTPPLTFAQYSRIHNVVASLARRFGRPDGTHCVFYGLCGAAIMREQYGRDATVTCGFGGVVIHVQDGIAVITAWGEPQLDGHVIATPDAFRCWVECNGFAIDFSAPTYQRGFDASSLGKAVTLPRIPLRMFQKPVAQVRGGFDRLAHVGDAFLQPDSGITADVIGTALERPGMATLVRAARDWHRPVPRTLPPSITMLDNRGAVAMIPLLERELAGVW
ncbi:hypothetical protein BL241_11540 [Ralstonia solanacearum]|nr:hypothetical protein BL241_11540 [Ralstonia solanacearum]